MGYWLKLYTDILDDPKYFKLSDNARLGMYEIFLVAKKIENGEITGNLPSIEDIAFLTRRKPKWWNNVISELAKAGVVDNSNGSNPKICKYSKRQRAIPPAERMKQHRKRKQTDNNEDDTEENDNATKRNGDKSKSTDKDKIREEEELINPYTAIWERETGKTWNDNKANAELLEIFGESGVTPAMFCEAIRGQKADSRYKVTTPVSVKTWAMNSVKKKGGTFWQRWSNKRDKKSWQAWLKE